MFLLLLFPLINPRRLQQLLLKQINIINALQRLFGFGFVFMKQANVFFASVEV
jgi:hypothetical protein